MNDSHTDLCTRIDDQNVAFVGILTKVGLFETEKCTDELRGCATIIPIGDTKLTLSERMNGSYH